MSHTTRPRVLLIKPVLPYPPDQGTKVASFSLIKSLKDDFEVTVLARLLSMDEIPHVRDLEKWCSRVVTVLAPNRRSLFHRLFYKIYYYLVSTFTRRSFKSLYDCPGVLKRAARELAAEDFDIVVIEYWQLYPLMDLFPPEKTVLFTHDIDMLVNRNISLLERHLTKKIQAVRRWLLEQKEEMKAYRKAKHVWTLTERDKAAVLTICRDQCQVDVFPFGVDLDFHSPAGMQRNHGEILFMGYMGAAFNRDALTYFIEKIYPLVEDLPGVSMTIVGGLLPKEVEYFGLRPEVEVVGNVPDVRPYLHRASCLVLPLRFGGGLRIRILEAMSAGLPIVSNSVSIAGMPFEPETDYLLAEAPEQFAAQIMRMLTDHELASKISASAQHRVREAYAFENQSKRAVTLARGLLDGAPGSG